LLKMCNEECTLIKNIIFAYSDPLYALIPNSFNQYFKEVETDARTCYHKALRNGFEVHKVDEPVLSEILDIYRSREERQGREINYHYTITREIRPDIRFGWPHPDYRAYECEKHYFDFYGCFLKDKMVAFLELLHSNGLSVVYSTMGHGEYLNKGIMKFLFLEAIKMNIGKMKYLVYGDADKKDERIYFLHDLGFVNSNAKIHLQGVSYYANE
jgi:hypothetical protein